VYVPGARTTSTLPVSPIAKLIAPRRSQLSPALMHPSFEVVIVPSGVDAVA
jgi:hypothetical protein